MEKQVIAMPQLTVSKTITGNLDSFKQKLDPNAALIIGGKLTLQVVTQNGIESIELDVMDISKMNMTFFVDGCEVDSEAELALI